jgi:hypothetical protein
MRTPDWQSDSALRYTRVELSDANAFVAAVHRHHDPVPGHRFSIGAMKSGKLVGVAICGRPKARQTCQRTILEVSRCCTDGTPNACSFLYGAAVRVAKILSFSKVQTFILDGEENGVSLIASGWTFDGYTKSDEESKGWNNRDARNEDQPKGRKQRWVKILAEQHSPEPKHEQATMFGGEQ